jgi:uncharacterized protein with ACT and thioredoxin-like domain
MEEVLLWWRGGRWVSERWRGLIALEEGEEVVVAGSMCRGTVTTQVKEERREEEPGVLAAVKELWEK